jgi:hypothetical protein
MVDSNDNHGECNGLFDAQPEVQLSLDTNLLWSTGDNA